METVDIGDPPFKTLAATVGGEIAVGPWGQWWLIREARRYFDFASGCR
jgi:hypothetical protein